MVSAHNERRSNVFAHVYIRARVLVSGRKIHNYSMPKIGAQELLRPVRPWPDHYFWQKWAARSLALQCTCAMPVRMALRGFIPDRLHNGLACQLSWVRESGIHKHCITSPVLVSWNRSYFLQSIIVYVNVERGRRKGVSFPSVSSPLPFLVLWENIMVWITRVVQY